MQEVLSQSLLGKNPTDGFTEPQWLRHDHLPTTAVGSFKGVVLVAANPHYSAKRNALEIAFREQSEQNNRQFCERFFTVWAEHLLGVKWWCNAIEFAYQVMVGESDDPDVHALIDWAARDKLVGGVDLVPFHSTADQITHGLRTQPKAGARGEALRIALRGAALETLRMTVLRLQPRVVLVASRSGAFLASQLGRQLVNENLAVAEPNLKCVFDDTIALSKVLAWPRHQTHELHHFRVDHTSGRSTLLLTLPAQLFSMQAGLSAMRPVLAKTIRVCL